MSFTSQEIFERIMEKAVEEAKPDSDPRYLQKFHVSQTADQLPDIRQRNAYYRAELEKQILEKREAERKRKEREALEEERLLRKIEADREKLQREYFEEIRQRELMQDEAVRRQQAIARKLEEIQEAEERKREEELRRRQEAAAAKIAALEAAMEKKRLEEENKRRQAALEKLYYWDAARAEWFRKNRWNSRDYVNSALEPGMGRDVGSGARGRGRTSGDGYLMGNLDDIYYATPLPVLADVYRRLVFEKTRIKEVIKERIKDGEG